MSLFEDFGKKVFGKASGLVAKSEGSRDYFAAATNAVNTMVKGKTPREFVKAGSVIQLVSRISGRSVQIVFSRQHNHLVVDALGGVGPAYTNANWEVSSPDNIRFSFRNQNNYLGMVNGFPVIIPTHPQSRPPPQAEFRVLDIFGMAQAIHLESVPMPGYFISFQQNGARADGTEFVKNERVAHFEVVLVSQGNNVPAEGYKSPSGGYTETAPPSYQDVTFSRSEPPQFEPAVNELSYPPLPRSGSSMPDPPQSASSRPNPSRAGSSMPEPPPSASSKPGSSQRRS